MSHSLWISPFTFWYMHFVSPSVPITFLSDSIPRHFRKKFFLSIYHSIMSTNAYNICRIVTLIWHLITSRRRPVLWSWQKWSGFRNYWHPIHVVNSFFLLLFLYILPSRLFYFGFQYTSVVFIHGQSLFPTVLALSRLFWVYWFILFFISFNFFFGLACIFCL
jgi:hypothetical protein